MESAAAAAGPAPLPTAGEQWENEGLREEYEPGFTKIVFEEILGDKGYRHFLLTQPPRLVVDLLEPRRPLPSLPSLALKGEAFSNLRMGAYPDRVRLVFDYHEGYFPEPWVRAEGRNLTVQVGNRQETAGLFLAIEEPAVIEAEPSLPLPLEEQGGDEGVFEDADEFVTTETGGSGVEVRLGGMVKLFSSLFAEDDKTGTPPHKAGDYAFNRVELRLKVTGYASDNVSFRSRVDFIHTIDSVYDSLSEIESGTGFSSKMHDVDLYFREGSFKLMNLLGEGMDLIVGRQRVRWGTSDEYNVIDNLNPVDYANLFLFDPDYFVEHLPMDGITLEYQFPFDFDLKLQEVYFVSFKPSPLPAGYEASMTAAQQEALNRLTSFYEVPSGVVRNILTDVPDYSLDSGIFGVRISGNLLNFDLGLSYFHGYHTLPLLKTLVTVISPGASSMNAAYTYPRLSVIGLDLAGELLSVGIWAEVGVYLPANHEVRIISFLPSGTIRDTVSLLERAYTKFTIGFDYTFGIGNGIYWNTQYNHGFYDELSYTPEAVRTLGLGRDPFMGELEDYYIVSFAHSFFSNALKLTLGFMLEVADYNDFHDRSAILFIPEVELTPFDGTSLRLGYAAIGGTTESKFGILAKSDRFFLLFKVLFN